MSSKKPLVSIIMPIYNGEQYVKESLNSILNQSYKSLEIIIVEDGSQDNTLHILSACTDKRLSIIHHSKNLGLSKSLNEGIKKASGKYIARMDVDDISDLERIEMQVNYLEVHKNIGICGTWAYVINENGKFMHKWKKVVNNSDILTFMLFDSPLIHPSIMAKAELLRQYSYSSDFPIAEDYALWVSLIKKTQFHNINKYLLSYRATPKKSSYIPTQQNSADKIRNIIFKKLGFSLTEEDMYYFNLMTKEKILKSINDFEKSAKIIRKILFQSRDIEISTKILKSMLADLWWRAVSQSSVPWFIKKLVFIKNLDISSLIFRRKLNLLLNRDIYN